MSIGNQE